MLKTRMPKCDPEDQEFCDDFPSLPEKLWCSRFRAAAGLPVGVLTRSKGLSHAPDALCHLLGFRYPLLQPDHVEIASCFASDRAKNAAAFKPVLSVKPEALLVERRYTR